MANELNQSSDPMPLGVAAGMRPARQRAPHPMQSHSIHVDLLVILLGLLASTVVVIALLLLPAASINRRPSLRSLPTTSSAKSLAGTRWRSCLALANARWDSLANVLAQS